jgi:predicted DNA binding protein|tara:strand:+ start:594 stop:767 length:174 start_codon:yes stop_codon:yes gene_type:complete
MAWKLKKEWEGKSIDSLNIPLNDLTQKQIEALNESVRNSLFVEDKPKKKKKDVGVEG